jgi:anti-sigma28 factor (negative regulator of flagellin synthesis)
MIVNNNEAAGASRLNLDQTTGSARTTAAGASQAAGSDTTFGADSISLTSSSNLVQQALSAGSAARAARVQALKALVQNNQYQPSTQEVSSALISAHIAGD